MGSRAKQGQRTLLLAIATFALALFAVACGSSDGGETATSETLSKAQYVKRADAICAETEKRQRALLGQFQRENKNAGNSQKALEKMISFAGLPPMAQQIEELSTLPQPEKESAKAKAYIAELEKGLKAAEQEPSTILAQPGAFTKAEEAAADFGFKTCSGA